jgi:hypothetical protein
MPFDINLKNHLTPKAVAQVIKDAPPLNLPVRQTVFKASKQHPLPIIGVDEISEVIQNVPVVRRGTPAVPISHGSRSISYIEPQGIDVSDFVSAATLNNWKLLDSSGLQQVINNKLGTMQRTIQKTNEALCAQALTGSINYQMQTDIGLDTYEISFGTPHSYSPDILWTAETTKIADLFRHLSDLDSEIQDAGWGGDVITLAGKKAYQAIIKLADTQAASRSTVKISMNGREINIGGYIVRQVSASYKGSMGSAVKEIPDTKVCMVDLAAPHTMFYLALDDMEAGLVPMPFFASPEYKKNPSGVEIVGRSKPIPAPVCKAVCWATVAAE